MERSYLFAFLFFSIPFLSLGQDTVKIKDNFFEPDTIYVIEGESVVWDHVGSVTHTSTSGDGCTSDGNWDSGNMTNGDQFTHTFNSDGLFDYYCEPHCGSGMTGVVVVGPNTSIEEKELPEPRIYPQPFGDRLNIEFGGKDIELLDVAVYDITGKRMQSLPSSELQGKNALRLDASEWGSGIYFVRLEFEEGSRTRRVIKR